MDHKQPLLRQLSIAVCGVLFVLVLGMLWIGSTATAQGESPAATPTPEAQTIAYTVQPGDTLGRLATQYGTTVEELVALNDIQNRDLIYVGQVLMIGAPAGWAPTSTPQPSGGPLTFTWSRVDWRHADPNYISTLHIEAQGGQPPYTFYHDGLVQEGATFEVVWQYGKSKPGSVGVMDASGTYVKEDYWLEPPRCPVGIEITEPDEDEVLEHFPRHFNIQWRHTVDPPPDEYGIEIEVREDGEWRPWKSYDHERGETDLFYVPDEFPGDLRGRLRMWGDFEGCGSKSKTPWRHFEFR